jgi:3-mercaptopyruvate sulfurtransferase SseA
MKASPLPLLRAAAAIALTCALPGWAEIVPAPVAKTEAEVRRVTAEDARRMVEAGRAILVDVRGADSFAAEHVAGAINIPEGEILSRKGELPKDKLVIAYCS